MRQFFAISLLVLCQSITAQKAITSEVLSSLEQSVNHDGASRALSNAIQSNPINKISLNGNNQNANDTYFSVEVMNSGITDQASSGRCWLFTGLNVLRQRATKNLGVGKFMFSHIHIFFYFSVIIPWVGWISY